MKVISALFRIAGLHSTTNLKTYEQAKNFFNPANTQSSSEEPLREERHIYVIDDIGAFTSPSNI